MEQKPKNESIDKNVEYGAIFDNTIDDVTVHDVVSSGGGDENIYNLSLSQEGVVNKVYKSLGRFVPNPKNTKEEKLNIVTKYMYFLPHPDNPESKLVVDCTSNWGQRDNIITKAFFHCKNSNSPALKKLGKDHFGRKQYNFTLFQIIKDSVQPDLVGKIKIFRFSKQISDIIAKATQTDASIDKIGINYSHPFNGVNFIVDVREKEYEDEKTGQKRTMISYEQSEFQTKESLLVVPNCDKEKIKATNEYAKEIFDYLKAEAPNLNDYLPKEWSPELEAMIIESVRLTIEDPHVFDAIYKKTYGKSFYSDNQPIQSSNSKTDTGLRLSADDMIKKDEPAATNAEQVAEEQTADVYGKTDELPDGFDDDEFTKEA